MDWDEALGGSAHDPADLANERIEIRRRAGVRVAYDREALQDPHDRRHGERSRRRRAAAAVRALFARS